MVLMNNRMNEHIALMRTDNKGYQLLQLEHESWCL